MSQKERTKEVETNDTNNYKTYVLNSLIVPINFEKHPKVIVVLKKISVNEAKRILQKGGFISAIGHEGTAKLLSKLFGVEIPVNRTPVYFELGDIGIHFFLKTRLPEGKVLTEEELQKADFWLVRSKVYTRKLYK